jgi:hypothetical protein
MSDKLFIKYVHYVMLMFFHQDVPNIFKIRNVRKLETKLYGTCTVHPVIILLVKNGLDSEHASKIEIKVEIEPRKKRSLMDSWFVFLSSP